MNCPWRVAKLAVFAPLCVFGLLLTACTSGGKPLDPNETRIPAPIIDGRWIVEANLPEGQPHAGRYTTIMSLTENGGQVAGSSRWSNGANSRYSGTVVGHTVRLERADTNGFEGVFEGAFSEDGHSIVGTGQNDPSSPHGNSATYSWWAKRILLPQQSANAATHCDKSELSWAIKYVTQPSWPGNPDPQSAATTNAIAALGRCSRSQPVMGETLVDRRGRYAGSIGGICFVDLNLSISYVDGLFHGASHFEGLECPTF